MRGRLGPLRAQVHEDPPLAFADRVLGKALGASGAVDRVVTASVDSHLNEVGFIVPGLGDAGDRQYGVD